MFSQTIIPRYCKYCFTAGLFFLIAGLLAVTAERTSLSVAIDDARFAGVPDSTVDRILAASYSRQLDVEKVIETLHFLASLPGEKIPLEPFVEKVDEGIAKRVDINQILAALNGKLGDYSFIMNLVPDAEKYPEDEYFSGVRLFSDSLAFGLERRELSRIIREHPDAGMMQLAVAAELMAFLKWMAFDEKDSERIISAGLQSGRFTLEWRKLPNIVRVATQRGLSHQRITETVAATLRSNGSVQSLLPKLEFTSRDLRGRPAVP